MSTPLPKRCAIYTRKSSEDGLEQEFNSLHAQREACEAFVRSQQGEGWRLLPAQFDDGGFSGGSVERPALQALLGAIRNHEIDIVVVYKVDRLSRSLADFARLVELFDEHNVSFVSVTQQFNTSTSMGRLTLNVLLSFAQFEREVTGERIRDKIAASKRKGLWMGGIVPLGYRVEDRKLVPHCEEADLVRRLFERYLELGTVRDLKTALDAEGLIIAPRTRRHGESKKPFSRGALYNLLQNPVYIGCIRHKGKSYEGQHAPILDRATWDEAQALLMANRQARKIRSRSQHPSLLAGFLYDDAGHPMSPSHSNRKGARYRYYVSQAVLLFKEGQAGSVTRVPAHTVESVVVGELLRVLKSPSEFIGLFDDSASPALHTDHLIECAKQRATGWKDLESAAQVEILQRVLYRVEVGRQRVRMNVDRAGLLDWLMPEARDRGNSPQGTALLEVPVSLRRCGIEARLVVREGENPPPPPQTVTALQKALHQALAWNRSLIRGEVDSMKALAKREGVTQRYIAHLLKLAWLAPDVIQAINAGTFPAHLTLARLKKGLPLDWEAQREAFGLAAQTR